MASSSLRRAEALAVQALTARGPNGVSMVHSMASGGDVPTDDEQATGLEREVMLAAHKGLDPYDMLAPKAASVLLNNRQQVSSRGNSFDSRNLFELAKNWGLRIRWGQAPNPKPCRGRAGRDAAAFVRTQPPPGQPSARGPGGVWLSAGGAPGPCPPRQPSRLPTFHCAPPARELGGEGKPGSASPPDWPVDAPLLCSWAPPLLEADFSPLILGSIQYLGSAPSIPSAPTRVASHLQNPKVNNGFQECVARTRTEGHHANQHKGNCIFLRCTTLLQTPLS
eukprot:bmy_04385T0